MNRRGLLQTLSVGLVSLGGGCSGILGPRHPPYLDDITVRNKDGVTHEFELTIEQSESVIHETTIELGRAQPPENVDYLPLEQVECEWSGRGPFVVLCTLDNGQTEAVQVDHTSDDLQASGEYAHVTFTATMRGTIDETAHLDDGGIQECSRSQTR